MKQTVRRIVDDFFNSPEWSLPKFEFPAPHAFAPALARPSELKLKVLSLNVWGLTIGPRLEDRVAALAETLAKNSEGFDIVAFQEVWFAKERDVLQAAAAKGGLPYSYHWCCGLGIPLWPKQHGTGLFLLSRFPIVETMYFRYPVNGKPYALSHGDYFATKGCALARLMTPVGPINMLLTHLHSYYMKEGENDEYLAHRVSQAFALAQIVNEINAQRDKGLTLLVGDLNSSPEEITYKIVTRLGRLTDCYAHVHPDLSECGLPQHLEDELSADEGEEEEEEEDRPRQRRRQGHRRNHSHHYGSRSRSRSQSRRSRSLSRGRGRGKGGEEGDRLPMDHLPYSVAEFRQMLPRKLEDVKEIFHEIVDSHFTYGTDDNCFSAHDKAARLDFVFSSTRPGSGWKIDAAYVYKQFLEPTADGRLPISDHFGVCVDFLYTQPQPQPAASPSSLSASSLSASSSDTSLPSPVAVASLPITPMLTTPPADGKIPRSGASSSNSSSSYALALEAVDEGFEIMASGTKEAQQRRRWHVTQAVVASFALLLLDMTGFLQAVAGPSVGQALWLLCLVIGCLYIFAEALLAALVVTGEITSNREVMQEMAIWKAARQAFPQLWDPEPETGRALALALSNKAPHDVTVSPAPTLTLPQQPLPSSTSLHVPDTGTGTGTDIPLGPEQAATTG